MVHVEPEGNETDNIDNRSGPAAESFLNEERTHRRGKHFLDTTDLHELHLCPELDEMHNEECKHYDTEHQHVL